MVDDTRPVPGILLRGDPGLDREIAADVREFPRGHGHPAGVAIERQASPGNSFSPVAVRPADATLRSLDALPREVVLGGEPLIEPHPQRGGLDSSLDDGRSRDGVAGPALQPRRRGALNVDPGCGQLEDLRGLVQGVVPLVQPDAAFLRFPRDPPVGGDREVFLGVIGEVAADIATVGPLEIGEVRAVQVRGIPPVNDDPVGRTLDQANIGTLVDRIGPFRGPVAGHRQQAVDEIFRPRRLPIRQIAEFTAEHESAVRSDLDDEIGILARIVVIVIFQPRVIGVEIRRPVLVVGVVRLDPRAACFVRRGCSRDRDCGCGKQAAEPLGCLAFHGRVFR